MTPSSTTRVLLQTIGFISLALGFAGIIVPLLPTTPFILLSAWCFAKSSPRWNVYLHNHKEFGPLLNNWKNHRSISLKHKFLASMMILLSIALILVSEKPSVVKGSIAGGLSIILTTLLLVKTAHRSK